MVGLLNEMNADFGSFDILSDEEVRQGLKVSRYVFSNKKEEASSDYVS